VDAKGNGRTTVGASGADVLTALLGALWAGAVPVFGAAAALEGMESARVTADAVVITPPSSTSAFSSAAPIGVALGVTTSGSTGGPRVVLYDGERLLAHTRAIAASLPAAMLTRLGIVLPITYAYGLVGQLLTAASAGGTAVLLHDVRGAAAQLDAMIERDVSGLQSTSTHLGALAEAARSLPRPPRLAGIASAGGPLSLDVARALRAAFPDARLFNQYGLTEAGPRVSVIDNTDEAFWRGSVGRPLPGIGLEVVDDAGARCAPDASGEVIVRSPFSMRGVFGEEPHEATAPLRTKDRGFVDRAGRLFIEGRLDDTANVAGVRVSLVDLGARLQHLLGAEFCVVVAVDDPLTGERAVALVPPSVVAPLATTPGARTARLPAAHAPAFSAAERPALLIAIDALPTLPSGKLDRVAARTAARAAWYDEGRRR
jgi:acyl-coenzyme A synthetase/AMP-(fatty) acid ligase